MSASNDPAPKWAEHLKTRDRYERFEACVRAYFKAKGVKVLISEGLVTAPGGGLWKMQLGLSNLSQVCGQFPEKEWPRRVAGHFEAMERSEAESAELEGQIGDYALVAPKLGVRLYEPGDIGGALAEMAAREDVPGLATVLCVDLPSAVRTVKNEEAEEWGVDPEEAFARAIANLEVLTDPGLEEMDFGDQGKLWVLQGDSFFTASLMLTLDRFPELMGKVGAFVSAPTRHAVLALPFSDAAAMNTCATLMAVTEGMYRDGPGSLSRRVWWTRGAEWMEIPYEIGEEGVSVRPPKEFMKVMEEMAGGGNG